MYNFYAIINHQVVLICNLSAVVTPCNHEQIDFYIMFFAAFKPYMWLYLILYDDDDNVAIALVSKY